MKKSHMISKYIFMFCLLSTFLPASAHAQQINERSGYNFKSVRSPFALARAIAIAQQKDGGFGTRQDVDINSVTNNSSAIGTLTEVQAILEGDNSDISLTSNNTQTSSGDSDATSNQNN